MLLKPHYTDAEVETIANSFIEVARGAALGAFREQQEQARKRMPGMVVPFNPTPEDIADAIGVAVSAAFLAFVLSQTDAVREAVEAEERAKKELDS